MTFWDTIYNKYPVKLHPTTEEADTLLIAFLNWFVANNQGERVQFARLHNDCVWNIKPEQLWVYFQSNLPVERETILERIPHIHQVTEFNFYSGIAKYNNKEIHWNPSEQQWKYCNHRTVHFNKTPTEGTNSELNSKEEESEPDEDTAQVEDLLRQTETTVTLAIQKLVSCPGTPSPANSPLPKASPLPGKSQLSTTEVSQTATPPMSKEKQTVPVLLPRTKTSSSSSQPTQTFSLPSTTKSLILPTSSRNPKGTASLSVPTSSAPTLVP